RGRGSRAPSSHPQPGPSVPAGSRRVRLVGSSGRCAGRVEVYSGGSWSSVCQEGWDLQDAAVVCRELGCGRALEAPSSARFGGERECGRGVGAGAVCSGQWRAAPEQGPAERGPRRCRARLSSLRAAGSGELRLVGGGGRCAGRVEVKHDGEWGSVCVFDFDWKALWASVVCRQLGCGQKALHFGKGDGPVSVARVNCDGSEAALWECWIGGWGSYKVDFHDWDAAVVCQGFSRLVGGAGACAGQLEVRQGRAWVGVCEDQVDMKAAQVVCRELGCGEPLAMAGSGRFGAASASLWDGGFQCNGTEPLLSACARRPAPSQGCSGRASIICSRKCREHRGLLGSVQHPRPDRPSCRSLHGLPPGERTLPLCAGSWAVAGPWRPRARRASVAARVRCGRTWPSAPGARSLSGNAGARKSASAGAASGQGPCAQVSGGQPQSRVRQRPRGVGGRAVTPLPPLQSRSPCGWQVAVGAAVAPWRCPITAPGAACAPTAPAPAPPAPCAASWAVGSGAGCRPTLPSSRPVPGWPGWAARTGPAHSGSAPRLPGTCRAAALAGTCTWNVRRTGMAALGQTLPHVPWVPPAQVALPVPASPTWGWLGSPSPHCLPVSPKVFPGEALEYRPWGRCLCQLCCAWCWGRCCAWPWVP
uniref:SRCR domain-containing protein n=1 Tax=Catharus ustulatus TaxID=91951 RepID=A0A8C3VHC1_CATUS